MENCLLSYFPDKLHDSKQMDLVLALDEGFA